MSDGLRITDVGPHGPAGSEPLSSPLWSSLRGPQGEAIPRGPKLISQADGLSVVEIFPGVLASLLAPPFSTAEMWGGRPPVDRLFPEEEALIARAGAKRRLEFTRGRVCARYAMEHLGVAAGPLLSRPDRSPAWPDGLIGSITHTDDFCGAVVAKRKDARSVGIDAEHAAGVSQSLWRIIFTAREQDHLMALPSSERVERAAIMFSAKEAFYKAQFPLTETWLDFLDVEVAPSAEGVQIRTVTECAEPPLAAEGAVWTGSGLVVTAVVFPWPEC